MSCACTCARSRAGVVVGEEEEEEGQGCASRLTRQATRESVINTVTLETMGFTIARLKRQLIRVNSRTIRDVLSQNGSILSTATVRDAKCTLPRFHHT